MADSLRTSSKIKSSIGVYHTWMLALREARKETKRKRACIEALLGNYLSVTEVGTEKQTRGLIFRDYASQSVLQHRI